MKALLIAIAVVINVVTVAVMTLVVAGSGWVLTRFLPLSLYQCSMLFLGSAFVMLYAKANQGKGRLPRFVPDDSVRLPGEDPDH